MTITLNVPLEIERQLDSPRETLRERIAKEQGLSMEAYALKLLTESVLPQDKSIKLVNLLQSWIYEDDTQEQQETGEYLIQALDENRLSDRKFFPDELKGVTW